MRKFTFITAALLLLSTFTFSMGGNPKDCRHEKKCEHQKNDKQKQGKGFHKIKELLNLTDAQMEQLKALRLSADKDLEDERLALKNERKTLEELKVKGQLTKEKVKESLARMGEIQNKIHAARMKNASEAIDILTEEQIVKAVD
ncbi:MAG: Spy/CpxP family protein refolding chaperone, partial [Fibrobacteres bacterium]|nr:Spy/CpxP family protein refolding chaperone [Fibrobacterota bacterium]